MIASRLRGLDIVTAARLLDCEVVDLFDSRLDYFTDELAQALIEDGRDAAFLWWPDGSFGFAMLPPDPGEDRDLAIAWAYGKARKLLECMYLDLQFTTYDPAQPQ